MKALEDEQKYPTQWWDAGRVGLMRWKEALDHWETSSRRLLQAYEALKEQVKGLNCALEERNRALEQSLKEEARLRSLLSTILDALPLGVLVWDSKGELLRANRWAKEILGTLDEKSAMAGSKQCHPLAVRLKELMSLAPTGSTRSDEVTVGEEATEVRHLRVVSSSLSNNEEGPIGGISVIEDLTEYRGLQEELARNQRLAAMGEMAATIVHQVRNPLGSIGLFASLMVDEESRDARCRIRWQIDKAIESMDQLLKNLLNFARPMKPKKKPLDLQVILAHCIEFIAPLARHKGVELSYFAPEELPQVKGDEEFLKQAFLNVLLNALQAMPKGGVLKVWIEEKMADKSSSGEGFLDVNIEDTGLGIPQEHLSKVFDPFFTTRSDGSGLGLTVVHKVIRAHGGRVRIHSEIGKGTRVKMEIPVV